LELSIAWNSDYLLWLELEGGGAESLLKRGGFLSLEAGGLPVAHFKRTLVADVPVLIWRRAPTTWRVGLERSRFQYFVDWIRVRMDSAF
jgi:heterotetrameric sarcosine oxidase gamma subunit